METIDTEHDDHAQPATEVTAPGARASKRAVELAEAAVIAGADKLAENLTIIDVAARLGITDCFVLMSASSDRQVSAVVDAIEDKLRELGAKPLRREGLSDATWVLLDYGDIVIHVQQAEQFEFYDLARLWKDCPTLPLPAQALVGR